jgi:aldehyde dehydrogenase (NAD+)
MIKVPGIIGGRDTWGTHTFTDLDPSTGLPLAEVARLGTDAVDAAVAAASAAAEVERLRSAGSRSDLMRELARLIRRDADRLAHLESCDAGKPLRQAKADTLVAARYFDFYAGVLLSLHGDTLPPMDGVLAFTAREPFGVTAHITPWNYPLQMAARTLAPSLAAGNCCVLKPAEDTPITTVEIARLALEAGFPPGVINVVTGLGPEAGAALAAHTGINHISFTGSRPVGSMVAVSAARNVIPAVLELGGKSPNLVFADADLDRSVPLIANAITQNAGQTCSAGSRVLVHESVHDEVVDRLKAWFEAMTIAPGVEDADMGPLISAKQRDRVANLVAAGRQEATLVTGGEPPREDRLNGGFFFQPTIFDDVPESATIYQQEIFGPVLAVSTFSDDDEAVRAANATEYGLVAAVWTQDIGRAHRVARDVRAGQVFINTYGAGGGIELPFGGWKASGYGREKGVEGLLGYTQTKTTVIGL